MAVEHRTEDESTPRVTQRPEPDEAPLDDAGAPRRRGRLGIAKRALGNANRHHVTNLAAALAYDAFLAIPSALLLALGLFGLLASPHDVTILVDKVGSVIPGQATSLLEDSLTRMTQQHSTGITIIGVGGVLALWSLSGAMQNLMWALNSVYERDETRGFVRRRLVAFEMVFFAVLAFALMFVALVLGPPLSHWLGSLLDQRRIVSIAWWVAEWPLLVVGLLVCFAAVLYLGPNHDARRWKLLSFGAATAVAIWLVGSGAFAVYVSQFGSYNKTWGALAAVVIMLTWLWLSAVALLLGAEIDAEANRDAPTLDGDERVRGTGARGERSLRRAGELSEPGSRARRDDERRADRPVSGH
jgi:membrane protein